MMPSEESLQIAAQCWADRNTSDRVMDSELAIAFAKRLDSAKSFAITTDHAIKHLKLALRDEGYYISWKANIAMAFIDEANRQRYDDPSGDIHKVANDAAEYFLKNLMS